MYITQEFALKNRVKRNNLQSKLLKKHKKVAASFTLFMSYYNKSV